MKYYLFFPEKTLPLLQLNICTFPDMHSTRLLSTLFFLLLFTSFAHSITFDDYFEDATLRIDYVFAGNKEKSDIFLSGMKRARWWAGRRSRLSDTPLRGNGQLIIRDHTTHDTIYAHTFSTLYQEWLLENEAKNVKRAFETSYCVPLPKSAADITVTLLDKYGKPICSMTHTVVPSDILIQHTKEARTPFYYVWKGRCLTPLVPRLSRDTDTIGGGRGRDYTQIPISPFENVDVRHNVDLAIIADGYTADEIGKFYSDCHRATEVLFEREPFRSLKERFNVVAVAPACAETGVSVPHLYDWRNSTTGIHYDTFYSERYLMTQDIHRVYDILDGIPFEHIMILANTATYGGGGIYNQITISSSDHPTFSQVFVHEFGHSYAGLGDEYAYDDMDTEWYPKDCEPWEPNLTTMYNFENKWQDLIDAGVKDVGLYEGAGYQSKGCWRPSQDCRMRTNAAPDFCPVCNRAIRSITDFYTVE